MVLPVLPCTKQKEGASKPDAAVLVSLVNETVPGYINVIQTRMLQLGIDTQRKMCVNFKMDQFAVIFSTPAWLQNLRVTTVEVLTCQLSGGGHNKVSLSLSLSALLQQ